ncbi:MAG: GIY-YIG nuclease family protein [Patescibacteria group bacterium]
MYYCYILRCSDNSLYCGMTNNLEKRVREHNSSTSKGAKYLRAKKPVQLVYSEQYPDIQAAMKREREVKKLTKAQKEALITSDSHSVES